MAPTPLFRVVRLAAGLSTLRTRKRTASFEVDADLELPLGGVEFIPGHVPRLGKTESEGEEVFGIHTAQSNRGSHATDQFDRRIAARFGWKWTGVKPAGWR